jgi:transposase
MTVSADEFLRRFLIHVLPRGLVRIRHFGIFANRRRAASLAAEHCSTSPSPEQQTKETNQLRYPLCSTPMLIIERMAAPRALGPAAGYWKILTILSAMSTRGMIARMSIEEPTDADIFLAYVEHVLCPAMRPGDVVVMDNLTSHKVDGVRDWIENQAAELIFLPSYSPDLNPIEKAWAKLKPLLRSTKARTKEALVEVISDLRPQITTEDAQAWFRLRLGTLQQP